MDPTAGILKLEELAKAIGNKQNPEQNTSSPVLNPKPFVWDSIIFSLASTIFGLSVSGIIVELFKSEQNSVTCFSELENRAQYSYINNYCYKFLPTAEYFPVILVLHAAALIIPHYLWRVIFSAQFDSFFSHAAKVETLQDIKTGEYPQKNYSIVDYLQKEFNDDKKSILRAYVGKLFFQLLLVCVLIVINGIFFRDINFNITFNCNDDDESSQLFGNVTCAYPRKIFINVLQLADNILLTLAMIVLVYSLFWCLLYNHCTQDKIADFCYNSCIDAKYYKPPGARLSCRQLKNDLNFLLALLSATNTGLERIFKRVLVENIVCQKFNDRKNFFIKCDPIRYKIESDVLNKETYKEHMRKENFNNVLPNDSEANNLHQRQQQQCQQTLQEQHNIEINEIDNKVDENNKPLIGNGENSIREEKRNKKNDEKKQLSEIIMEICNGIREEQKVFDGDKFEKFETCAMDLASGYHSYLFDIARWQRQTISIMLGPSSKDQDDAYKSEDHGCVNIMKIPINLFDSQKWSEDFFKKIQTYIYQPGLSKTAKLSLVVVGPLDDGSKVTTVNKIIEGLSKGDTYFEEGCVMLILQPVSIEGQNISERFNEWKPEIEGPWYKGDQSGRDHDSCNSQEELIKLWHEGDLSKYVKKTTWLKDATTISNCESTRSCREIEAKCGRLNCKFKLKVFYYGEESLED